MGGGGWREGLCNLNGDSYLISLVFLTFPFLLFNEAKVGELELIPSDRHTFTLMIIVNNVITVFSGLHLTRSRESEP